MDGFTLSGWMRLCRWLKHGARRRRTVARPWMLGLSLAIVCQAALGQAMYRIKPLGSLGGCLTDTPSAWGLNGADEVTGYACNAHGDTHAFLWKNNGKPMVDLGPAGIGTFSQGRAINAFGLVTGVTDTSSEEIAFLSSGDGTPMRKIYDSLGGNSVVPNAINDRGQLTGSASTDDPTVAHAFIWKNDGSPLLDLGTASSDESEGWAINTSGQVAGNVRKATSSNHAFIWKNNGTPMRDLGTLGGDSSFAWYINASGQVAGDSTLVPGKDWYHAFLWRNDGTHMQDLGTLGGQSFATALNDSGQVAGESFIHGSVHAFVWLNDGKPMKNLGTFGGTSSNSNDLNSSGQVTGYAYLAGDAISHAFLWRNDGTTKQDLNKLIDPLDPLNSRVTLTAGLFINDKGNVLAEGTDSSTGRPGLYLLQGTVLTLSPRSLAFGSQLINTTSAAKSVTVTNTSPKVVAIASIALTGSDPGQFPSTNNCGTSLAGDATCTIKVTFKPTAKGTKSAVLNVNGGGDGLRSVTLSGSALSLMD